MVNASTSQPEATDLLQTKQVFIMAALCLVLGLGIGYVTRGMQISPSREVSAAYPAGHPAVASAARMPTLDEMKMMADKHAAPLLARLKTNPNDISVLSQVATIYHGTHQFKEAASYYGKAVQADPKNVPLRTQLASSLYRSGDVDGALEQLNQALRYDPKDANCLFNLGRILLQGKGDAKGAMAAWQRLLKSNPQMSDDRKAEVQKLMADVMTTLGNPQQAKGATGK